MRHQDGTNWSSGSNGTKNVVAGRESWAPGLGGRVEWFLGDVFRQLGVNANSTVTERPFRERVTRTGITFGSLWRLRA